MALHVSPVLTNLAQGAKIVQNFLTYTYTKAKSSSKFKRSEEISRDQT